MKQIFLILILLGITSLFSLKAQSKRYGTFEVSNEQLLNLSAEKLLRDVKKIKGETWPEVRFLSRLQTDPLKSVALFLALDYQKNYVPNLVKSLPVKHVTPTEVWTEYEMKLPWPMENSRYIHSSNLSKVENCYRVDWKLIQSTTADKVSGYATFCPIKDSKQTSFYYQNHVAPKSVFAGIFKGIMVNDTEETLVAINKFIEDKGLNAPKLTSKYVQIIEESLQGKSPYLHLMKTH
ncbi:MAG: hypothetical protein ACPGJV_01560 [Bacteriovoracaceae bacterium]